MCVVEDVKEHVRVNPCAKKPRIAMRQAGRGSDSKGRRDFHGQSTQWVVIRESLSNVLVICSGYLVVASYSTTPSPFPPPS